MANITGEINAGSLSGTVSSSGGLNGSAQPGTNNDHRTLSGRDASDQHPESSITNLTVDLAARPSEVISDEEIMAL